MAKNLLIVHPLFWDIQNDKDNLGEALDADIAVASKLVFIARKNFVKVSEMVEAVLFHSPNNVNFKTRVLAVFMLGADWGVDRAVNLSFNQIGEGEEKS